MIWRKVMGAMKVLANPLLPEYVNFFSFPILGTLCYPYCQTAHDQ